MKSNNHQIILKFLVLFISSLLLFGCDPAYPQGKLRVKNIKKISVGSSVHIEIIHPNIGGTFVHDWKNSEIEVIEGEEFIEITDLNIKGIKEGKVKIKVSSTTVLSIEAYADGKEDRVYSKIMEVEIVP